MARRNCRGGRMPDRARAEATAAALIAHGRAVTALTATGPSTQSMEEDMPMNRYTFPVPSAQDNSPCEDPSPCSDPIQERVLETLCYQNQLLLDILGAINALTAALLSTQCQR